MTAESHLEGRVSRLEEQITAGFERIETLFRQQLVDLKTEQIADLKDRYERLADDQRRLWDLIHKLELRDSARTGSSKAIAAVGHFFSASVGGVVTWLATWLAGGAPPHHP
jgi:hypothetical protein